jgi:hypothetical protein
MAGTEYINGRAEFVIEIAPKLPEKYLMRGRIWVDVEEFAVVRMEGPTREEPFLLDQKRSLRSPVREARAFLVSRV